MTRILALLALGAGSTAFAQTAPTNTGAVTPEPAANGKLPEANIQKFTPTGTSQGFIWVPSARQLPAQGVGFDVLVNYAHRPYQRSVVDNGQLLRAEGVVDSLTAFHLRGAYGVTDYFEIAANMPVVQLTNLGVGAGEVINNPLVQLGDVELLASIRPVSEEVVGLWVAPFVTIPTGGTFVTHALPTFGARGGISKTADILHLAAEVGYRAIPKNNFIDATFAVDDAFLYGIGMGFQISEMARFNLELNGDLVVGPGRQFATADQFKSAIHSPVEALADVVVHTSTGIRATVGAGPGITPAVGTPSFRVIAGIGYAPNGGSDKDKDGILDNVDECPLDPEDFDEFEDVDGCPDLDNDQDGIVDLEDSCPNDPEDLDTFQDVDGCPDPDNDQDLILDIADACPMDPEDRDGFEDDNGCPDPDNDNDGILDVNDKCPMVPENINGIDDEDGCPDEVRDSDQDGILDPDDTCPLKPEDYDGFEDTDGCPDIDNDNDGILDVFDSCMMEPENFNGVEDEDGCPDDDLRVKVTKDQIVILDKVLFVTAKDVIVTDSYPILNDVFSVLRDHPEIKRIRVEGHTDSRGGEGYNQRLSEARAKAVVRYLVKAGIEESRLIAEGFGEARPIADNATAAGQDQNRRVEFHIVKE